MKKITKPATFRELGSFDVAELSKLVATLPASLWTVENERKENDFAVFHHTQHIIFRFTPGNRDHTNFYTNPIWPVWQSRLLPLMDAITDQYQHQERVYSKIMLARLLPEQVIDRHVDGAGANLYTHKVHVPLITSPEVDFMIEDDVRHLEVGQAYEVNNIVRHGVSNPTKTARVHLIFEHYDAAA